MFRRHRQTFRDAVDWMDGRWDGSPMATWDRAPWAGRPRRRGRGLLTLIAIVLALVAAERLFFNRPFRRRSTFGTIVSVLVVVALGRAAMQWRGGAWRRRRQPSGW